MSDDTPQSMEIRIRVTAAEHDLIRRAVHRAAREHMSDYVRDSVLVTACEELGLDVLHYLSTGQERPRGTGDSKIRPRRKPRIRRRS